MMQHKQNSPSRKNGRSRRGATILIVLVLISVTLAFSYAMMRSQTTGAQVTQNYDRRANAKQAALAGLSIGMRKMSESGWTGIGTDLIGSLSNELSYRVTYETGDASLTPGHPDEAEYPYRVTVTSTGTSVAAGDPTQQSTHTVQAVMQLVRRRMQATPAAWTQVQPYTLYQWNGSDGRAVKFETPARIEGPVAIQNALELCQDYPGDGNAEAWSGSIDGLTILGSALSASTIEDLFNGDITLASLLAEPDNAPIASWQFDEPQASQVAIDRLGWHHGIFNGAASGAAGDSGSGAAAFDGINDQVFVGDAGFDTGKITILAKVKVDTFQEEMQIACNSISNYTFWALSVEGKNRRLKFTVRSWYGSYEELYSADNILSANEWVDVAAVYSGTTLSLYLNGAPVGHKNMFGYLAVNPLADLSIGIRSPGSARARYLRDLQAQHLSGLHDQRPFDGPLTINRGLVSPHTQSLLEQDLALATSDVAISAGEPVPHPGQVSAYQLYPGGKIYPVVQLAGSLSNASLGPDATSNPLGLFVCTDELRLNDNVQITGTVLSYRDGSSGDLRIEGVNVTLQAVNLPPLEGATEPVQLPVAIVKNDFEITNNSSGSLHGLAVTWDDFRLHAGGIATNFQVTGKLLVSEIQLERRTEWNQGSSWWNSRMSEFMRTVDWRDPTAASFPDALATAYDLDPTPRFHVRPATTSRQYHWHDWSQPLFIAHPVDQGLRWDLVGWRDNLQAP